MGTYGDLWGPPWAYGDLWGLNGAYGDLWGLVGTYGGLWGPMGTYGHLWGPMGTYGRLWGPVGTSGDLWGPMGSFGDPLAPMGTYGVGGINFLYTHFDTNPPPRPFLQAGTHFPAPCAPTPNNNGASRCATAPPPPPRHTRAHTHRHGGISRPRAPPRGLGAVNSPVGFVTGHPGTAAQSGPAGKAARTLGRRPGEALTQPNSNPPSSKH